MSNPLTLRSLLSALGSPALASGSVRLLRHTVTSDRELLRKRGVDTEPPEGLSLLDRDDKVTALRLDPRLAEAYTAEQKADVFTRHGKTAERVLVFAAGSGLSAEFLGVWKVKGSLGFDAFRIRDTAKRMLR